LVGIPKICRSTLHSLKLTASSPLKASHGGNVRFFQELVTLGRPIFFQPKNLVVLRKGPPLPKTQSIEVSLQDTAEVLNLFVCLKTWVLANRVGLYLFKMICFFTMMVNHHFSPPFRGRLFVCFQPL